MKLSQRKILLYAIASIACALITFMIFIPEPSKTQPQGFDTTVPDGRPAEISDSKTEAYAFADTIQPDTVHTARASADSSVSLVQSTIKSMNSPLPKAEEPEPRPRRSPKAAPAPEMPAKDTVEKRREFSGDSRSERRSVSACIHQDQKVTDGSRVLIRITEDAVLDGIALNSGTVLTGIAEISGSRVRILVTSVRTPEGIRSTDLSVYDNDSQEGIYCPQLSSEKAARSTGSAISKRIASTLSGSSVVSAVAEGGSSYISEKLERRQVKLSADYRITLQAR